MMAATAIAILGFNTLSLHVSAERAKVEKLQARIAADLRDIRALEAELRTRARLPVLQKWNDNVLALSAPTSRQFADTAVQLAAYAPSAPAAAPGTPAVQMALATETTSTVPTPGLVKAAYTVPAAPLPATVVIDYTGERLPAAKAAPAKTAEPKTAVAEAKKPDKKLETKKPDTKPAAPVKLAEAKPKPAAKATTKLAKADDLDALIGAIDSAAAAERGGFRKVAMQ